MPRGKKTDKPGLVKNPAFRRRGRSQAEEEMEQDLDDSFENIHEDTTDLAHQGLQLGYVSEDDGQVPLPGVATPVRETPPNTGNQAPEWFQCYGALLDTMVSKQEENTCRMNELSDIIDAKEQSYVWKKEGLKRQNEVHVKVVKKNRAALTAFDQGNTPRARQYIEEGIAIMTERQKDLKIADISEAGWETVNVYKSHPVAVDSDDDKKIRKADREAIERLAAKRIKTRRTRPYSRWYGGNRQGGSSYQRPDQGGYRAFGSERSVDHSQRTTYVPERRRRASANDLCYFCGEKGHWADACPSKGRKDKCEYNLFPPGARCLLIAASGDEVFIIETVYCYT